MFLRLLFAAARFRAVSALQEVLAVLRAQGEIAPGPAGMDDAVLEAVLRRLD